MFAAAREKLYKLYNCSGQPWRWILQIIYDISTCDVMDDTDDMGVRIYHGT